MSALQEPSPGKVFASVLFAGGPEPVESPAALEALAALQAEWGPADSLSPVLPFTFTSYYQQEMGPHLWRRAVSFQKLCPRTALPDLKRFAVALEQRLADEQGRRRVNLDPGLVTSENFLLATGKNNPHRVYLGQGVFADLALLFRDGRFAPLPWSYPDYSAPELAGFLGQMRARLLADLRSAKG